MRVRLSKLCVFLALAACGNKPAAAPTPAPSADAVTNPEAVAPAPAMPPIGLTVASPGAEPRRVVRLATEKPAKFELTFDTETATKRGNLISSTIVVTGTLTPTMEGAAGQLRFEIASVTAVDRAHQLIEAAGINYYLKEYKPPSFVVGVTAAGDLSPDSSAWNFPEILLNQDQALHEIIAKWVPAFPDDAIGPGATWTQVKSDIVNGIALIRTSEMRLVEPAPAEAPGRAGVQVSFSEAGGPQQALIGGKPLRIISYAATGRIDYQVATPGDGLAASKGTSTATLVYDHRGNQETIVRTTTWSIAPAGTSRGAVIQSQR